MNTRNRIPLVVACAVAGAVAACSSSPPPELVDARHAYQRAAQSPNASFVPGHVREAQQSLAQAERAYEDDGDDPKTRDLAYIAKMNAISAASAGEAARAIHDKQLALQDLEQSKQRQATALAGQLGQAQSKLSEAQQRLESERRARIAADQKASEAFEKIEGLETKREARGLVLTLSGSVLFASGKATLLPSAQRRLDSVADALAKDDRPILVVGHTDSQGSDEMNRQLSEQRAQAVKTFLSKRVPSDRIRVEGMGESQPVASNDTPEGRANNRRVEIVLQDTGGAQGSGDRQEQQEQNKP